MFLRKPLVGYGTGGISFALQQYDLIHQLPLSTRYDPMTDSTYLNLLYQYGILGLIGFTCLVTTCWKAAKYILRSYQIIICSIIVVYLVLFVFNCWLSEVTGSEILMLFLTLCFSGAVQRQSSTAPLEEQSTILENNSTNMDRI